MQGNGILIGCGRNRYPRVKNVTLRARLVEDDWYHIPEHLFDIDAASFKNVEWPEFIGDPVTKNEFMQVLGR